MGGQGRAGNWMDEYSTCGSKPRDVSTGCLGNEGADHLIWLRHYLSLWKMGRICAGEKVRNRYTKHSSSDESKVEEVK